MTTRTESFVGVATPTLVYVIPKYREDFDKLAITPTPGHQWEFCKVTTLCKNDGQRWERRCNSKSLEADGVMVIFQWWDERLEAAPPSQDPAP